MQRLDRAASARFRNPRFPASLALPSLTATLVCLFAYGLAPLAPARAAKDDAGGVVVGLPPPPPSAGIRLRRDAIYLLHRLPRHAA